MTTPFTYGGVPVTQDLFAWKVLKLKFIGWEKLLQERGYTPRDGWKFDDIRHELDYKDWMAIYEGCTSVLHPKYTAMNYEYSLYEWNHWWQDWRGNCPYADADSSYSSREGMRTSILPDAQQKVYEKVLEKLEGHFKDKSPEGIARMKQDLMHVMLSKGFNAADYSGFHCHRTVDYCIYNNFNNRYDIRMHQAVLDSVICRVQLAGTVIVADYGYIAEKMRIQNIFSPFPERLRIALAQGLGYPVIQDIAGEFDYIALQMKSEEPGFNPLDDKAPKPSATIPPELVEEFSKLIASAGED